MSGIGPAVVEHYLAHPEAWPFDGATPVRLEETHSAWVLLGATKVLKIKKPVNFGFLDFATLERRRACCEAEVRLNRRFAPALYEGLVTFTGGVMGLRCEPGVHSGDEYGVLMARFPDAGQLDRRLAAGDLSLSDLSAFGQSWARRQKEFARAEASSPFGSAAAVQKPVAANFFHLWPKVAYINNGAARLTALEAKSREEGAALAPRFSRRLIEGFIREGHGDLHLKNLCLYQETIQAFDCIDFSEQLRWIDTVSDLAFLFMDLAARSANPEAMALLNGWLTESGDHEGLALLPYYFRYRALVRAKVAALDLAQARTAVAREACIDRLEAQLSLAERPLFAPGLILMHGVSGSGKTHWSTRLAPRLGALHLRSDVERKRLLGLDATARPATAGERATRYGAEMGQRTYEHLNFLTREHLLSGYRVLVDATFLNPDELLAFQALGQTLGVPTVIVHCTAPEAQLIDRVQARSSAGKDASDADLTVLKAQLARGAGAPAGTSLTLTPQSDEVAVLERLEALLAR